MFYNTVTLGGLPWETVVKAYRTKLGKKTFQTLDEYVVDFFSAIEADGSLLPDKRTDKIIHRNIARELRELRSGCNNAGEFRKRLTDAIKELGKYKKIDFFNEDFDKDFVKRFKDVSDAIADIILPKSFIRGNKRDLNKFLYLRFSQTKLLSGFSGVVFAGFGEDEYLPRLQHFVCDCMVNNRLRKWQVEERAITIDNPGEVIPLADNEVIKTIISGINPSFHKKVEEQAFNLMVGIPKLFTELQTKLTVAEKTKLRKELTKPILDSIEDFWDKIEKLRKEKYEDPIISTISNLPVAELGSVAETFINAAQIHKKVNPSFETVGGPVDVAVISKGDGFVWTKRKHYFDADKNPMFALKYFS